jgi:hypothetical protein
MKKITLLFAFAFYSYLSFANNAFETVVIITFFGSFLVDVLIKDVLIKDVFITRFYQTCNGLFCFSNQVNSEILASNLNFSNF